MKYNSPEHSGLELIISQTDNGFLARSFTFGNRKDMVFKTFQEVVNFSAEHFGLLGVGEKIHLIIDGEK